MTTVQTETTGHFPRWKEKIGGVIAPEERLPWGQTIASGLQHSLAMSGATIVAPLIMGFDPNLALFFSGIGTLIFFAVVGGRVPSYLGSSFSFIAVVIAASGYSGHGPNAGIDLALGGIVVAGVVYSIIGLIVIATGSAWVEYLMPPIVTGAVVAVIGLNLAPVAVKALSGSQFDALVGLLTVLVIGLIAVSTTGIWPDHSWHHCRLSAVSHPHQRPGVGEADRLCRTRRSSVDWAAEIHRAHVPSPRNVPDCARGNHPGRGESRPHQSDRCDDRAQPRFVSRASVSRRRTGYDSVRLGRRSRGDNLRREHRGHGGDQGLLDGAFRDCRHRRHPARLLAQSRRLDPFDSGSGAWRS
jgi:hypothetical protein